LLLFVVVIVVICTCINQIKVIEANPFRLLLVGWFLPLSWSSQRRAQASAPGDKLLVELPALPFAPPVPDHSGIGRSQVYYGSYNPAGRQTAAVACNSIFTAIRHYHGLLRYQRFF